MYIILLNMGLALVLFIFNGFLGKLQYGYRERLFQYGKFSFSKDEDQNFSGNFFLKVVNPAIYVSVLCGIFQKANLQDIGRSFWMIIPFYWILRLLYIIAKNYFVFVNWGYGLFSAVLSLVLGEGVFFFILVPLMDAGEDIFIPIDQLRNAVWFAMIAYAAKIIWDISKSLHGDSSLYPAQKREKIILTKYDAFSKKYGDWILELIHGDYFSPLQKEKGKFVCLVYAIMIYEDYNRPKVYRIFEGLIKKLCSKREMTLGIMQVKSSQSISDRESIKIAMEKLAAAYENYLYDDPARHAIEDYNSGANYAIEVDAIYSELLGLLSIDDLIEDSEAHI